MQSSSGEEQGWCITPIPPLSPQLQEQLQGPCVPQMDVLQGCHKAAEAAGSREVDKLNFTNYSAMCDVLKLSNNPILKQ